MAVDFALFLSPEGIALAHRQDAGHWAFVGETRLDVDDLAAALADLRKIGEARGGADFETVLILPDDQILYTSFMAPTADAAMTVARIEDGLDGLTPYPVADLHYDHRAVEADRVKVAVVAQETLDEARSFAESHGFKTAGFGAMPPAERFPGVPVFGPDTGMDLAADGLIFGADEWVDRAAEADKADGEEASPAPEVAAKVPSREEDTAPKGTQAEPSVPAETEAPSAPAEGDAKETTAKPDTPEQPAPAEQAAEPAKEPTAEAKPKAEPDPQPEPDPEPSATDVEVLPSPPKPVLDFDTDSDADVPEQPAAPATGLITALKADETEAEPPAPAAPDTAAKFLADTPGAEDETSALAARRSPSKPILPLDPEPEPEAQDDDGPSRDAAPAPSAPPAKKVEAPSTPARKRRLATPKAETPKPAPETPARRFTPMAPTDPASAPVQQNRSDADSPDADSGGLSFTARRGKAAAPKSDPGRIVGARSSRLGFGVADRTPDGPNLHPDAAPSANDGASAEPGAGRKIASQLFKVRDAAKPRAKAKVEPEAPPRDRTEPVDTTSAGLGGAASAPTSNPFDGPPPSQPSAAGSALARVAGMMPSFGALKSRTTGLLPSRGDRGQSPAAAQSGASSAAGTADGTLTTGLLARKPVEPSGPSFRTGLILTVILLFLLGAVAIWSVIFLPDSPMARLFSSPDDDVAISDPLDAPGAPAVVTAPPAIGTRDQGDVATDTAADPVEEVAALAPAADAEADAPALQEELAALATEVEDATLPDIDAELDLAPLPPPPEDLLPSREEAEQLYAQDGIWTRTPDRPELSPFDITDDVYVASIDPEVTGLDAIALPDAATNAFESFRRIPSPPAFGTELDVDERGLVAATPEGVLTPEGAFVVAGRPSVDAVPRPRTEAPIADAAAEADPAVPSLNVEDAILSTFRPTPRPGDLGELRERQLLGGLTVTELAARRPTSRPLSAQEAAQQASLFPGDAATTPDTDAVAIEGATALAIAQSRLPSIRPTNIADIVAAAAQAAPAETAPAVPAAAVAAQPSIPSNASVTRAATERNAIRLRDVNLIGVTGTPSNRRAMVRLPSGRFVRVGVGDRLDGGRVAAIGETTLQYVRNGRNITLEIPG